MEKETIKQLILDAQEILHKKSTITRDMKIDYDFLAKTAKVVAITGPRRAGKSCFLDQIRQETGTPPERTVWIDFAEIPWSGFGPADWERLWAAALELGCGENPLFLLDEIQEAPEMESGLLYLLNRGGAIFVSGSNAEVFEENLAKVLRGKVLTYRLQPLSFAEFLRFKGESFPPALSTSQAARRRILLEEYLTWGGFPEVVLAERDELKRNLLDSYWDVMLFRDVIERHGIQNLALVEKMLVKILLSFTREVSVHKWYNDFRSQGLKVGKDSLYQYLGYFEEAFFVHLAQNAAAPGGAKKVYLVDNGLYQKVKDRRDLGKLWENQCFMDLVRSGQKPRYWRTSAGEIDFITDTEMVQATVELTDGNRGREEGAFAAARGSFPSHGTRILTM